MTRQKQPGVLRRIIRHMLQPREMAWAFGSGLWFAAVTYVASERQQHGILTQAESSTIITLVGFGGFLVLQTIKAYQDVRREERARGDRSAEAQMNGE